MINNSEVTYGPNTACSTIDGLLMNGNYSVLLILDVQRAAFRYELACNATMIYPSLLDGRTGSYLMVASPRPDHEAIQIKILDDSE